MSHAPLDPRPDRDETPFRSILAAWTIAAILLSLGAVFSGLRHHDASATASAPVLHRQQATKSAPTSDEDDVVW